MLRHPRTARLRLVTTQRLRKLEDVFDDLTFERRFRVDTEAELIVSEHDAESRPYQALRWRPSARLLKRLDPSPDDVFVDAGCGKGRAVFQAARLYPFKRVIGFDLLPELISTAEQNIKENRHRLKCANVELLVADAATWEIPDDVTIVLANSPFRGELFKHFIRQLLASVDRNPRRVRLVYMNPFEPRTVESTGRFSLLWASEESFSSAAVRVYDVLPSQADA
jgi:SAM-dependent methyltransferase